MRRGNGGGSRCPGNCSRNRWGRGRGRSGFSSFSGKLPDVVECNDAVSFKLVLGTLLFLG